MSRRGMLVAAIATLLGLAAAAILFLLFTRSSEPDAPSTAGSGVGAGRAAFGATACGAR